MPVSITIDAEKIGKMLWSLKILRSRLCNHVFIEHHLHGRVQGVSICCQGLYRSRKSVSLAGNTDSWAFCQIAEMIVLLPIKLFSLINDPSFKVFSVGCKPELSCWKSLPFLFEFNRVRYSDSGKWSWIAELDNFGRGYVVCSEWNIIRLKISWLF